MPDAPLTWDLDGLAAALAIDLAALRRNLPRLVRAHGFPPALPGLGRSRRWDRQAVVDWLAVRRGAPALHQVAPPPSAEPDYAALLDQRAEQLAARAAARARPGRRPCPPSASAT